MKKIIPIAIALMLVGGEAEAVDAKGIYTTFGDQTCSQVMSAHANMEVQGKRDFSGNHNVFNLIGYIQGYVTAFNKQTTGAKNHFSGMTEIDIVNWIASWCRSNPQKKLSHAMSALTKSRTK